jgi:hypothetical protein
MSKPSDLPPGVSQFDEHINPTDTKKPADDWLIEFDRETEGGLEAVQVLQCPHCQSRDVDTTQHHGLIKSLAYYCNECDMESEIIK